MSLYKDDSAFETFVGVSKLYYIIIRNNKWKTVNYVPTFYILECSKQHSKVFFYC